MGQPLNPIQREDKKKAIFGNTYKVAFDNVKVRFEIESTDKKFVEEKIELFLLQDDNNPELDDAVERITAMIDDVAGTKTE